MTKTTIIAVILILILLAGCATTGSTLKAENSVRGPAKGMDWKVPGVGMEFVWIDAVRCWVGKYEVTNTEYRKHKPDYDSGTFKKLSLNGDRQPVVYISFNDAVAFAKWLTERERDAGRISAGMEYRLPTEKEWQKFAECGDQRTYPWGNRLPPTRGNYADTAADRAFSWKGGDGYSDGSAVTCAVEKSGKNKWGLYGVGGNAWEVCTKDRNGAYGSLRGGSWRVFPSEKDKLRCSYRGLVRIGASYRFGTFGLRLVLSSREASTPQRTP